MTAKTAQAPLAGRLSIHHVQLEIRYLFLADASAADFLVALQVRAVVATKGAPTILARADALGIAPVEERPDLTDTRHMKRARQGGYSGLRALREKSVCPGPTACSPVV
jgi:hypothetical protein